MSAGNPSSANSLALSEQVDALCDRFEEALHRGEAGDLADWLPPPGPLREAALPELARVELEHRLRVGEEVRAEEYLARYPELAADSTLVAKLLASEQHVGCETLHPVPSADSEATVPERSTAATGPDDQPPAIEGYHLSGEKLGSGGMAVVWLGRDTILNRDVAVKVMRHALQGQPQMQRRFVEEAQVASQLQHPGIPPVHALDTLSDGRPYFVMKLVKGRTLAELLGERGGAEDLPRWIAIFEQVCQAVAYAHSKGVLHRDLKPHNVMVGAFSEVQVMDWGLAKVLANDNLEEEQEASSGSTVETSTPPDGEARTGAGTVLGTWAYMPPEQARGAAGRPDRRSDVFGLGAILCELLTGQPPYPGPSTEARALAQVGLLAPARRRLAACGADGALIELARSCLEADPGWRPADAAAVARAVAGYQVEVRERLRTAELQRAAAEARAEEEARTRQVADAKTAVERRARRLTAVLAAAGVLFVAGAGVGAWRLQDRQQKTDAGVAELLTQAEVRGDVEAARQAASLADQGGASAELRLRAQELTSQLEKENAQEKRDRSLLVNLLEVHRPCEGSKFERDGTGFLMTASEPGADEQFASAFRAWGVAVDAEPTEEAAARLRRARRRS